MFDFSTTPITKDITLKAQWECGAADEPYNYDLWDSDQIMRIYHSSAHQWAYATTVAAANTLMTLTSPSASASNWAFLNADGSVQVWLSVGANMVEQVEFGRGYTGAVPDNAFSSVAFTSLLSIKGFHDGVTRIGSNFANGHSKSLSIRIPTSVTGVGSAFLYNNSTLGVIAAESQNAPTDTQSLAQTSSSASAYTNGVTIAGASASKWISSLPNNTSAPYRKLIHI